jgi:hypothetical protein
MQIESNKKLIYFFFTIFLDKKSNIDKLKATRNTQEMLALKRSKSFYYL